MGHRHGGVSCLILNYRPDGKVGYGAGVVVSATGHVLTSLHVVEGAKTLRAMLYKPGRVSYTPMDGGLGRYLFENSADMVEVTVADQDSTNDLALVKIGADTSHISRPSFATALPRVGDPIIVLGHPQEAVWSFTSGTVSGLPNGAIQHDAMVSSGSSGGPLLNRRGEIVGISVAKVISETRGFAFARPIAMASNWVASTHEEMLDLSSPERAARTCWHATELASPHLVECFDWDNQWSTYLDAKNELNRRFEGQLPAALARAPRPRQERVGRDAEVEHGALVARGPSLRGAGALG